MQLTPEEKLILAAAKVHPATEDLERMDKLIPHIRDWEFLRTNSIERGLGPLLNKKISRLTNQSLIPEDVKLSLQQSYYITMSRSIVLVHAFQHMVDAFTHNGIAVIALKGIYLSEWLYQDIGLRQMSDIDLLVKKEEAAQCLEILANLGYRPESEAESELDKKLEVIHYTPMVLNGVSVELHIKLHQDLEKYHLPVDQLWENATAVTLHGKRVYILDLYDLLIHLCIHLDRHFHQGHVQFTCFSDITNLLDKQLETLDWVEFTETCREYNCEKIVFGYLMLVHKYMHAVLPAGIVHTYQRMLARENEQLFLKYLNGYRGFTSGMPKHLGNFTHLESFGDRVRYFVQILFPSRSFMVTKFQIKYPVLYPFYYLYRFYIGLKGIAFVIKKKNRQ